MTVSDSDAQLVGRARDGDAGAFEALVHRHLRAAYAVSLAELGNVADAEDALQDAFVTALERLDECRQPDRFEAWLVQIARNRARDLRRRRTIRLASPLEAAETRASGSSPSADAERADLRERLQAALGHLSEVQREVVLLHDMEGWKHREIAEVLGLPEGTVRSHLFHARRALRARLGSGAYAEESDGYAAY